MNLGNEVTALGRLIGLITGDAATPTFNESWFSDPVGSLRETGTRLHDFAALLSDVLGPGMRAPSAELPQGMWYQVPNPLTGIATPFCIIANEPTQPSGQLGVGALHTIGLGSLNFTAYTYVPLFDYSTDGAPFLPGTSGNPIHLGVQVSGATPFTVDGVSFTAVDLDAQIHLSDELPSFKLVFEGLTTSPNTFTSLSALLEPNVETWLAEVLVQSDAWMNLFVGGQLPDPVTGVLPEKPINTVGQLLMLGGLLTQDTQGTYHLALDQLKGKTAAQIAENFAFAVLNSLAAVEFPIVSLPGGGIFIAHEKDGTTDLYGVRVAAQVALGGSSDKNGNPGTAVDLCLGTWFTGETDASSWLQRTTKNAVPLPPGLSVFVLQKATDGTLSFAPSFELTSAGVNVRGGGDAPLINVSGVSLGAAELRIYLDADGWKFGAAARLQDVGFPLGSDFTGSHSGDGSNPVAQNLLASDDSPAPPGQNNATAPAFSAEAAYVQGYSPLFEILDPSGNPTDLVWFPVQKRFGPISCEKIGVKVDATSDPFLGVVFDGGVSIGGLDVELDQLSVGVHLKEAADPSGYVLDLNGMAVSYTSSAVQISGGLLKTITSGGVEYDGEAVLQAEQLGIHAVGSYATLPGGGTSLFIFALLNAPIGGPACLFITGLAAGFGYNRSLRIPGQNDVHSFPLLAGLVDPSAIGGTNPSAAAALATLQSWVPPARGEYWLAAGIQFTTFEVINTNALLIVEFGKELLVAVVGISTLKQPMVGETFVYAELDLEAVYQPALGEFRASAVLAPSSYVLRPEVQLTGGFAFASWFGPSEHAGDFVFTIGGYHPAFNPPSYYPQVPRVGVNWQVDSNTSLIGGAYFALTPTAMMGGVSLQVTFSEGPLKAWLKADADGILFYRPFYIIVDASISIGVSLHVQILFIDRTLSVEIGAAFELWGPPVDFKVHVHWYIVSFTIGQGQPNPPKALGWGDFKTLLPSKTQNAAGADTTSTTPAYITITPTKGLKSTHQINGMTFWLVRAAQLNVAVASAVPASQVVVRSGGTGKDRTFAGVPVAMRSVNGGVPASDYQSTQTMAIIVLSATDMAHISGCMASGCTVCPPTCKDPLADLDRWQVQATQQKLPQALWGDPVPDGQNANINPATPTVAATTGVTLQPLQPQVTNCTPEMVIDVVFVDRTINADDEFRLSIQRDARPCPAVPRPADSFVEIAQINLETTAGARSGLFAALGALGINGWTNAPLPKMAAQPGHSFGDEPLEGQPLCTIS